MQQLPMARQAARQPAARMSAYQLMHVTLASLTTPAGSSIGICLRAAGGQLLHSSRAAEDLLRLACRGHTLTP